MSSVERVRLFVGAQVPSEACATIRSAAAGPLSEAAWRVAPEAQWHVTALFIGDRAAGLVDAITMQVKHIASITPRIQLHQGQLVTMPKQDPTMLWVRFTPHPALTALHHALAKALGAEPSPYQPYWPHITLARTRRRLALQATSTWVLPILELRELTLFRSDPGPEGSVHTPLRTWPLAAQ